MLTISNRSHILKTAITTIEPEPGPEDPGQTTSKAAAEEEANQHFRRFAEENRLPITLEESNDPMIEGEYGNLYPAEHKIEAYLFDKETPHAKNKLLKHCRKDSESVLAKLDDFDKGLDWILSVPEPVCWPQGDNAARFFFDPGDKKFLELVLRLLGIKRKKRVSKETKQRLRKQGFKKKKIAA